MSSINKLTDNRITCIDEAVITSLCAAGQILLSSNLDAHIYEETRSLRRLRQQVNSASRPLLAKDTYLNLYDRLFRHVSLALLNQGYQLTSKQPHQSLQRLLSQHLPNAEVQRMITHRHLLKKTGQVALCAESIATLTKLLANYDTQDSQACQTLYQND